MDPDQPGPSQSPDPNVTPPLMRSTYIPPAPRTPPRSPTGIANAARDFVQELGTMRRGVGIERRRRELGDNLPDIFFDPNPGVNATIAKLEYLQGKFRETADRMITNLNITPPRQGPRERRTPPPAHVTRPPPARPFGGIAVADIVPGQERITRTHAPRDFLSSIPMPDELMYPVDFPDQGPEPLDLLQMTDPGNLTPPLIPAPAPRNWLQAFDDGMELMDNFEAMYKRSRQPVVTDLLDDEDLPLEEVGDDLVVDICLDDYIQKEAERLVVGLLFPEAADKQMRRRSYGPSMPPRAANARRGSAPGKLRTDYPSFRSSFGREWPDVPADALDLNDISMGSMGSGVSRASGRSPAKAFGAEWPSIGSGVEDLMDVSMGGMLDVTGPSERRSYGGAAGARFPPSPRRVSAPGVLRTGPSSRFPPIREDLPQATAEIPMGPVEEGMAAFHRMASSALKRRLVIGEVFEFPKPALSPQLREILGESAFTSRASGGVPVVTTPKPYSPVPGPSNRSPMYVSPPPLGVSPIDFTSPLVSPVRPPMYDPEQDFDLDQPSPRRFTNIQYEDYDPYEAPRRPRRLRESNIRPRILDFDAPELQASPVRPPPAPMKPQQRLQYDSLVPQALDFDQADAPQVTNRLVRPAASRRPRPTAAFLQAARAATAPMSEAPPPTTALVIPIETDPDVFGPAPPRKIVRPKTKRLNFSRAKVAKITTDQSEYEAFKSRLKSLPNTIEIPTSYSVNRIKTVPVWYKQLRMEIPRQELEPLTEADSLPLTNDSGEFSRIEQSFRPDAQVALPSQDLGRRYEDQEEMDRVTARAAAQLQNLLGPIQEVSVTTQKVTSEISMRPDPWTPPRIQLPEPSPEDRQWLEASDSEFDEELSTIAIENERRERLAQQEREALQRLSRSTIASSGKAKLTGRTSQQVPKPSCDSNTCVPAPSSSRLALPKRGIPKTRMSYQKK